MTHQPFSFIVSRFSVIPTIILSWKVVAFLNDHILTGIVSCFLFVCLLVGWLVLVLFSRDRVWLPFLKKTWDWGRGLGRGSQHEWERVRKGKSMTTNLNQCMFIVVGRKKCKCKRLMFRMEFLAWCLIKLTSFL